MNWRDIILPVVRLYWRIFQPQTYGVKALILHHDGSQKVLLVRHSYGDRILWNLPGGGFNPKKESAIAAAIREVREELDTELVNPAEVCTYYTNAEGKHDSVIVVSGTVHKERFTVGGEISEYRWVGQLDALADGESIAKVARYAIKHLNS